MGRINGFHGGHTRAEKSSPCITHSLGKRSSQLNADSSSGNAETAPQASRIARLHKLIVKILQKLLLNCSATRGMHSSVFG
ncbi:uncharacterized protein RCO7_04386 [Rhynchosporium graminicola]|uniref:Uncharacterized protein n=1 Tax=Rhynchosporium graminicola TaxID=2792576 RepID=A0A1E1JRV5_9HELO|nr:uncharacterized protein RCO7_04386 [Rhynchosporium commune]